MEIRTQIGRSFQGTSPRRVEQQWRGPSCGTAFQQRKSLPRGYASGRQACVAVVRVSLPQKDLRQRKEIRHIFNFRTLTPLGINRDLAFLELVAPLTHARVQFYLHTTVLC